MRYEAELTLPDDTPGPEGYLIDQLEVGDLVRRYEQYFIVMSLRPAHVPSFSKYDYVRLWSHGHTNVLNHGNKLCLSYYFKWLESDHFTKVSK